MKQVNPTTLHYGALAGVMGLGLGLRFWQLDLKPLWLDEVITALFSLGRSYTDVPLNAVFSLATLDQIFTFQPGVSCGEIVARVAVDSVHPPLFFCLMYGWMAGMMHLTDHWVWALRSLPALMGVAAIAAVYLLNRLAFSPTAGLMGAALMAVSPFAVYLSQEARHYTVPMLLITLSLAALVQMQHDLQQQRLRPLVWLSWIGLNGLGFYVHYFSVLALIAEVAVLGGWMLWQRSQIRRYDWMALVLAIAGVGLIAAPWLPTLLRHTNRPETDWMRPYEPSWLDYLAPMYQTLGNWALMLIALPVEGQPWAIAIPCAILMLGFTGWIGWQFFRGLKRLWQHPSYRPSFILLAGFISCILVQFFGVIYILGKDITVVPRYNFIYFPAVCALLAASLLPSPLSTPSPSTLHPFTPSPSTPPLSIPSPSRPLIALLLVGILSSAFVVNNFAFQKSYHPDQVAKTLYLEPESPLVVIVGYRSLQEVALGLSFALELRQFFPNDATQIPVQYGFVANQSRLRQFWRDIAQVPQPLTPPLNLWVLASSSVKRRDFPEQLQLSNPTQTDPRHQSLCIIDRNQSYRLGFPYQLYRCKP